MENDDISVIESKEQQAVDEYCRQHDVQGLIEGLVTRYLSERPKDMKPKEFFAQQLRLEMLAGDEVHSSCFFPTRSQTYCRRRLPCCPTALLETRRFKESQRCGSTTCQHS
ncbi:Pde11 [Symbiodinium necroappetens]|uniref:Pde11 protein n=1 Tax=Symbiodinium necroappetens TaxID=1628268 RepID=A0A812QF76_9DINO|nr:Pde11 [Symbiodinium necroappetens]